MDFTPSAQTLPDTPHGFVPCVVCGVPELLAYSRQW
jgi:hypothetical protein